MEYHSFLLYLSIAIVIYIFLFPSPYGVSFILIDVFEISVTNWLYKFPSPYGVIFILICLNLEDWEVDFNEVSVSLWSIIHSYKIKIELIKQMKNMFPSPYGVIFILTEKSRGGIMLSFEGFRLLTEYHSFLFKKNTDE